MGIAANGAVSTLASLIVAVVVFGVLKVFLAAQDSSTWSASEQTIMLTAVPIAVAIGVLLMAFGSLTRRG